MSDYHLVSTFHAARVTLANARKAGDAVAAAAAEAQVAAARAAVDAALADGRVAFATHLLDLDFDCLGEILSLLNTFDASSASHTCTTLRSALFRGGLPGPLAAVCSTWWGTDPGRDAANKEAAVRALDGMGPALGAKLLCFAFERTPYLDEWPSSHSFDEGHARVLARALDAAPRTALIDITFSSASDDDDGRMADILSSPERVFATAPQVHVRMNDEFDTNLVQRLASAGVCVASISQDEPRYVESNIIEGAAALAANTLTRLHVDRTGTLNLTTRFPVLRRLILDIKYPEIFTINVPSLTALAPILKDIQIHSSPPHDRPQMDGFGFVPGRLARFVAAIQGVTRVCFGPYLIATLSQNEIENLRQLTALSSLRELEISYYKTWVASEYEDPPYHGGVNRSFRALVVGDAVANLPPLPPGLTRLKFSGATRVAFGHQLPGLRVLDWRGSLPKAPCSSFFWEQSHCRFFERAQHLNVPLAIPSAAIAPNLHTLLIGYGMRKLFVDSPWTQPDVTRDLPGDFDLWTLVAARTALRVVVIEHALLFCRAPGGFDTTTAGFAALLARDAKDLVSVHTHDCVIQGGHESAVENFLHALEESSGRVCRAGIKECLFCVLHDGSKELHYGRGIERDR